MRTHVNLYKGNKKIIEMKALTALKIKKSSDIQTANMETSEENEDKDDNDGTLCCNSYIYWCL